MQEIYTHEITGTMAEIHALHLLFSFALLIIYVDIVPPIFSMETPHNLNVKTLCSLDMANRSPTLSPTHCETNMKPIAQVKKKFLYSKPVPYPPPKLLC